MWQSSHWKNTHSYTKLQLYLIIQLRPIMNHLIFNNWLNLYSQLWVVNNLSVTFPKNVQLQLLQNPPTIYTNVKSFSMYISSQITCLLAIGIFCFYKRYKNFKVLLKKIYLVLCNKNYEYCVFLEIKIVLFFETKNPFVCYYQTCHLNIVFFFEWQGKSASIKMYNGWILFWTKKNVELFSLRVLKLIME